MGRGAEKASTPSTRTPAPGGRNAGSPAATVCDLALSPTNGAGEGNGGDFGSPEHRGRQSTARRDTSTTKARSRLPRRDGLP